MTDLPLVVDIGPAISQPVHSHKPGRCDFSLRREEPPCNSRIPLQRSGRSVSRSTSQASSILQGNPIPVVQEIPSAHHAVPAGRAAGQAGAGTPYSSLQSSTARPSLWAARWVAPPWRLPCRRFLVPVCPRCPPLSLVWCLHRLLHRRQSHLGSKPGSRLRGAYSRAGAGPPCPASATTFPRGI
jgi:hypothetical protein